ncbi:Qat anti-phage system QueC-like protein QatC [Bacillus paranthracis]|nr:Qat anti-phage system QueC-like protein QatC [Bacillus paranthracis]MCU5174630.1 7-cyano-7-deazaguanine synthase [Bacillus paranthracis]
MIKNEFVIRINSDDKFSVDNVSIDYNLEQHSTFTYTFWNNTFDSLPHFFSKVGLDLFYISLAVFGVDRVVSRDKAQDCWTRNIRLYIPVLEIEKWIENKLLLESILDFLSGDKWDIEFRSREFTEKEIEAKKRIEEFNGEKINKETICMFSGGLDSFIGAIDLLHEQSSVNNLLFVSHYGGGKGVREYQKFLSEKLIDHYGLTLDHFKSFFASAKRGVENTTRTRSLMFFSHAIVIATGMEEQVNLLIPENGLISLNIPLTNSRLGSSSTRTTHPYYMRLLQRLINNLKINVSINNPYQFKTKGEMIQECRNIEFLKENLNYTMSCSHPDQGRMDGETETLHCGYCLPCVIRRASILKAEIEDGSRYRDRDFTSGPTAKTNLKSYNIGISKHNKKYVFLKIQNSGPIETNIEQFIGVYNRGMEELSSLLEEYNEEVLS